MNVTLCTYKCHTYTFSTHCGIWSVLFCFALFTCRKGIVSTGVPLAFDAVTQVLLFAFIFLFKCEHKSFAFLFSHRGRWRDLLQSRRHDLQHRDDWRGLVEGTVSRTYRSVPGRLRSADRVSNTLPKSIFAQASLKQTSILLNRRKNLYLTIKSEQIFKISWFVLYYNNILLWMCRLKKHQAKPDQKQTCTPLQGTDGIWPYSSFLSLDFYFTNVITVMTRNGSAILIKASWQPVLCLSSDAVTVT